VDQPYPGIVSEVVVETGADVGLAHDGDADRLIAVDERGCVVDGDHIMAIAVWIFCERECCRIIP